MPHTPAPWTVGTDEDSHLIFDGNLQIVADTLRDDGDDETEFANAKLCAAAPALLAACKRADPYLFNAPLEGVLDVWEAVRAAIAAAEGQS